MGRPRLELELLNCSGTKRVSGGGGRGKGYGGRGSSGRGRNRGGGRGSGGRGFSEKGNRGGDRGSGEGAQIEHCEGTSEFPKCWPKNVVIPNVESENDVSPYVHNDIRISIYNLMESKYTIEEIMDVLGISEAKIEQFEDVDVNMSQVVGIAIQITIKELPITQALGDEERMNEEDGIDE
ncbi:unnamed protein product [Lactuca saligna]|uniref:Uncharacterized protein n=1 Tax=Lactuca saligna TaxID=75948 RepID=A0AA36EBU7_LACSI|nr:unnamed protein product [Lactuca saligna]